MNRRTLIQSLLAIPAAMAAAAPKLARLDLWGPRAPRGVVDSPITIPNRKIVAGSMIFREASLMPDGSISIGYTINPSYPEPMNGRRWHPMDLEIGEAEAALALAHDANPSNSRA